MKIQIPKKIEYCITTPNPCPFLMQVIIITSLNLHKRKEKHQKETPDNHNYVITGEQVQELQCDEVLLLWRRVQGLPRNSKAPPWFCEGCSAASRTDRARTLLQIYIINLSYFGTKQMVTKLYVKRVKLF